MTHDDWWTLQGEALYATESAHDASWLAWDCAQAAMRPENEDLGAEVERLEGENKKLREDAAWQRAYSTGST